MTNTLILKAEILKKGYTMSELAKIIGISHASLSYKVNNKREFNQSEIINICDVLDIDEELRDAIFFARKVEETSTLA